MDHLCGGARTCESGDGTCALDRAAGELVEELMPRVFAKIEEVTGSPDISMVVLALMLGTFCARVLKNTERVMDGRADEEGVHGMWRAFLHPIFQVAPDPRKVFSDVGDKIKEHLLELLRKGSHN